MIERSLAVSIHGRYLVEPAARPDAPLLIGFHGYAEAADVQMARLQAIPGSDQWTVVCVQGLHRFYRGRSNDVVASWMTRQDRELLIADNRAYVDAVVAEVQRDWRPSPVVVYSGFSQGVATAFRAAAWAGRAAAVIACGGDIPPELAGEQLTGIGGVLAGRGTRDAWYTAEKLQADQARLAAAGVPVDVVSLDAGHDWTPEFGAAAGVFLARLSG
jgi:predicted esterase